VKVKKVMHGYNIGVEALDDIRQVIKVDAELKSSKQKGIDLLSLCNRKLGNGGSTQFWNDIWCGNQALINRILRGGVEDAQLFELRLIIAHIVLTSQKDSWLWSLDVSKGFTVASVRSLIDSHTLECGLIATRWNRSIPIKVNIFLWRLWLNKLPSRVNSDRREWFLWLDSLSIFFKARVFLEAVGGTLLWSI
nr:hypothetical protein [Tanacetum cinerariifolium]